MALPKRVSGRCLLTLLALVAAACSHAAGAAGGAAAAAAPPAAAPNAGRSSPAAATVNNSSLNSPKPPMRAACSIVGDVPTCVDGATGVRLAQGVACGKTQWCGPDAGGQGLCAFTFKPRSTQCRDAPGPCGLPSYCSGSSALCLSTGVMPAGTPCRPPSHPCELGSVCNGVTATCTPNRPAPEGFECAWFTKTENRVGANVADASRQQRLQQRRRPVLTPLGPVRPKPLPRLPQPQALAGGQRLLLGSTSSSAAPTNDVWLAAAADAVEPSDAQAEGATAHDIIAAGVEEPEEDDSWEASPLQALPGADAADAAAAAGTAGLTRRRGRRTGQDGAGGISSTDVADALDWKEPKAVRCSGQCRAGLCRIEVDRQGCCYVRQEDWWRPRHANVTMHWDLGAVSVQERVKAGDGGGSRGKPHYREWHCWS